MFASGAPPVRQPAMAGFVDTEGRNPFARPPERPAGPSYGGSTTAYISGTFRWSPIDDEDRPPRARVATDLVASESRPQLATKKENDLDDVDNGAGGSADAISSAHSEPVSSPPRARATEYLAASESRLQIANKKTVESSGVDNSAGGNDGTIFFALSEPASSPRTPGNDGSSVRSACPCETPDTPATTELATSSIRRGTEKAAPVVLGSVLQTRGELLPADDLMKGAALKQVQAPDIPRNNLDETPTRPSRAKTGNTRPEPAQAPAAELKLATIKRKATPPFSEEPTVLLKPPAAAAKRRKKSSSPNPEAPLTEAAPRQPRRTEIEMLLDDARHYGYTNVPELCVVSGGPCVVDGLSGVVTRAAAHARERRVEKERAERGRDEVGEV